VELTVLSAMAGWDFDHAAEQMREWDLSWVDLWGEIYGEPIDALSQAAAERAAATLEAADLTAPLPRVANLDDTVEIGEEAFREKHLAALDRALASARILRPKYVRLIAGRFSAVSPGGSNVGASSVTSPGWPQRTAKHRRILDAGFLPTIENEADSCFLATPQEFIEFFDWLPHRYRA